MPTWQKVVRFVVVSVLLFFFLLQVWGAWIKFVNGHNTIVTSGETLEAARLPTLSLCPGFKDPNRDYYEQYADLHSFLEDFEGGF